nr:60S ribosomal protein L34 [Tanacetum cinerariifolium]
MRGRDGCMASILVPGKELSNGLIQIKNDLDLANCIAIGYKNEKVIDMFLEHHGYDLSHWIQTDIDNNDDEISDVEMEDITGYAISDFMGEDDIVIPNRSINDHFLNKLCNGSYINDFSDKPGVGESSQPCGKELEIDSDNKDVGKQFKLVDEGKKWDWPYKKEKDEDELPKKDKGKLLISPKKGRLIEHYSRLWDYKKQLLDTNLGSLVHLYVNEKDDGKIYFKRIYICFKAMIEGWSAGCRKVIGLDGCFLKGSCRGELLTAMDRNPNSWCRAFFKMDRGCAAYENGISESYHNSIRIAKGKPLVTIYFIKPVGGSSMWPQTLEEPPLPPVLRKMAGHNKKGCKKEKQPKPTVEKRASGRKKADSNFVFQTYDKDGGDADPSSAGPSVADPSFAGPNVADPSSAGPSVADPSSAGPIVADPSSAGPSVANSTGSGTQTITKDHIVADPTDDIPTQQSKTSDAAKIIEDAIATGRLKTVGLKRRCKSERIAKRAKAFQFSKDGAGSCLDKAWDVDDVLAGK